MAPAFLCNFYILYVRISCKNIILLHPLKGQCQEGTPLLLQNVCLSYIVVP